MADRVVHASPRRLSRPDDPIDRDTLAVPFATLGTLCVVAGGMVAAVTARAPTEAGTWAVAYLVLVAGVAQVGLGVGQALLAAEAPPSRLVAAELTLWNCANAGVLAGTLLGVEPLIDAGGGLLMLALALFAHRVRSGKDRPRWPLFAYRLLVITLLTSIPIGLLLARAGSV